MPDQSSASATLRFFTEQGLISDDEATLVSELFTPDFPFAAAMGIAESVHVQVKVADIGTLPHDKILAQGVTAQREAPNFRKYGFPNGVAVIFTSGPIAEEDLIPGAVTRPLPFVDHLGIDLREDSPDSRAVYADLAERALAAGWRHVRQGGPQAPVRGCQCEVPEKSWVYPPDGHGRPIEFAFGELELLSSADTSCDYRPIDPQHPLARLVPKVNQTRAPQTVTISPR
ncbi:hypothetical protein [Plantactinospora endophytica]|uniref:Uncharacterized protein n=1 Tax=Plantactinospora endophytica TaxID=673535 RepID=A0ABQ4E8N6_9ACTN|nr:hypothetical protein [Plantactinospora endophytica]GIG90647.1 hypothetical protein Pen02_55830 [Plantactinospora endophytica]